MVSWFCQYPLSYIKKYTHIFFERGEHKTENLVIKIYHFSLSIVFLILYIISALFTQLLCFCTFFNSQRNGLSNNGLNIIYGFLGSREIDRKINQNSLFFLKMRGGWTHGVIQSLNYTTIQILSGRAVSWPQPRSQHSG